MIVALVSLLLFPREMAGSRSATPDARSYILNLYRLESHAQFADFSIFLTPELSAIVINDRGEKQQEVGKLDFDPICDCQDAEDLKSHIRSLSENGSEATASVSLRFADHSTRVVHLRLKRTPKGWAIDDIGTKEFPSLRTFLAQP